MKNSGWFKPTVESVICRKADIHLPVFKTITTGVYLFKHRYKETKKYVGKSQALYSGRDDGKQLQPLLFNTTLISSSICVNK